MRRWRAQFQEALASYGNGLIGLLPRVRSRGNRRSRLDERTEALLSTFITEQYETLKQQSKKAVFLLLQREAERRKIPAPSYTTFLDRLNKRPLLSGAEASGLECISQRGAVPCTACSLLFVYGRYLFLLPSGRHRARQKGLVHV